MQHTAGAVAPRPAAPPLVRFGVFEVDLQASELRKNGRKVRLEGQPFQILKTLLERPGQLITREELQRQLWPADTFVDFEVGINAAVKRLRHALGDNAEAPQYVETLPRRGYRFIHPLECADAPALPIAAPRNGQRGTALIVGVLLAALVGSIAFNVAGLRDRIVPSKNNGRTRIAVLPLENLTADSEKDYLVVALQDQLIVHLAKIKAFEVRDRDVVRRYKGANTPPTEIGRQLSLDAMLTGSVFQAGDRIHVTLQLRRTESDHLLWSEEYTKDLDSVFRMAVEVARTVAAHLHVGITAQEAAQLGQDRPVVPEALENYFLGKYRRGDDPAQRVPYFERAIALDDGFALAWQGLSDALWRIALSSQRRPSEVCPRAERAARQALTLDDSLWEAHMALSNVMYVCTWDFDEAERAIARAQALNPDRVNPNYQAWVGRTNVAIEAFARLVALDPVSPETRQNLGYAYLMAGQYATAEEHYRQAIEKDPTRGAGHGHLALALAMTGRDAEAITECETGLSARGREPGQAALAGCAWIYAISGRRADAMRLMREIEATAKWVDPLHIARIWDGLGDVEQALKKFQEAYEEHSPWMANMRMWPMLSKRLRDDPRFEALLHKVNIPIHSAPPPGFVHAPGGGRDFSPADRPGPKTRPPS